jgi:hypothetical protein
MPYSIRFAPVYACAEARFDWHIEARRGEATQPARSLAPTRTPSSSLIVYIAWLSLIHIGERPPDGDE